MKKISALLLSVIVITMVIVTLVEKERSRSIQRIRPLSGDESQAEFIRHKDQKFPFEKVTGKNGRVYHLPPLGKVYHSDRTGRVVSVEDIPPGEAIQAREEALKALEAASQ